MTGNGGQVSLKEHVERIFDEFKDRCTSERTEDLKAFEEFKKGLDEKTKLQAIEYERRLTAYPTIKDFNELKEKVTIEFSTAVGRARALPIVLGVVAVIISLVVAAVAFYK